MVIAATPVMPAAFAIARDRRIVRPMKRAAAAA
jgi:hypothetical protein